MTDNAKPQGMGRARARTLELGIIGICLLGLFFVFQPFSKTLFGVGAVVVVFGGLIFNLVPLCKPDRQIRSVVAGAGIVAVVFLVVVLLALGSAELYGVYIESRAS